MKKVLIKRVYENYSVEDGYRILVDRLWPRGVKKEEAHVDLWLKDIAPSTGLRKWFNHEIEKWFEFEQRYIQEIENNPLASEVLEKQINNNKILTLVYGAKDEKHNQAVVIKNWLSQK